LTPKTPKYTDCAKAASNTVSLSLVRLQVTTQPIYFVGSGSETDEESTNMFFSTVGSKMKVSQKPTLSEKNSESYLVFDIKINRGLLTMFPYVKDSTGKNNIPNQEGEFLFNVEDATIFIVNGHLGDPDLGYVCMEFRNAQLYHCGWLSFCVVVLLLHLVL
jgi:hypothetical protein